MNIKNKVGEIWGPGFNEEMIAGNILEVLHNIPGSHWLEVLMLENINIQKLLLKQLRNTIKRKAAS